MKSDWNVKIYISLKEEIFDPAGKSINDSLVNLDFDDVDSVRIGKYILIKVLNKNEEEVKSYAEKMCQKLLVNPVTENYSFVLEKV